MHQKKISFCRIFNYLSETYLKIFNFKNYIPIVLPV